MGRVTKRSEEWNRAEGPARLAAPIRWTTGLEYRLMFVLWAILAAAVANDNPQRVLTNTHETRQQVAFELTAPDEAVFTVTREFAARSPADPIGLERQFELLNESVVTSFAIQTDGAWRKGRLAPVRDDDPRIYGGTPNRPWASLAPESYRSFTISTASFRTAGKLQIRYTLWARGESVPGGRRWTYCEKGGPSGDQEPAAEISLPAGHPELRVHPDADKGDCFVVEKTEPDGKTVAARFGVYRFAPGIWWWRLEVSVPKRTAEVPSPTDAAPIVFVLDASRSQEREGGLAPQLAIVDAFLANVPGAEVELVMTSRTAARVFGRFVPASAFRQTLPADLVEQPLGNGSFLDRGAALAAEALHQIGKPGRIILMTDGVVRSRFDRRATIAALRRAPEGTLVHLLYPSAGKMPGSTSHRVPEGLGALPAAFGGAVYAVNVNLVDGVVRPLGPKTLSRLFRPDALDSLSLVDPSKSSRPYWPDWSHDRTGNSVGRIAVGETGLWSGISTIPPPNRLELTGWIWSKKLRLSILRDPAFERRLARLAVSEDMLMECQDGRRQRKDAVIQGFAVPGLMFWAAGSGEWEPYGRGGIYYPGCLAGSGGSGTGDGRRLVPQDLVPEIAPLLERCALSPDPAGTVRVGIETDQQEILDVTVEGGDEPVRRCMELGDSSPIDVQPEAFTRQLPTHVRPAGRGALRAEDSAPTPDDFDFGKPARAKKIEDGCDPTASGKCS